MGCPHLKYVVKRSVSLRIARGNYTVYVSLYRARKSDRVKGARPKTRRGETYQNGVTTLRPIVLKKRSATCLNRAIEMFVYAVRELNSTPRQQ